MAQNLSSLEFSLDDMIKQKKQENRSRKMAPVKNKQKNHSKGQIYESIPLDQEISHSYLEKRPPPRNNYRSDRPRPTKSNMPGKGSQPPKRKVYQEVYEEDTEVSDEDSEEQSGYKKSGADLRKKLNSITVR